MYKDPTEFRRRFAEYKKGKLPYKAGIPYNDDNHNIEYDHARATQLGYTPDETGHYFTRDYETGRYLKSPAHPTVMKSIVNDLAEGYNPYYNKKDGQLYSDTWIKPLKDEVDTPYLPKFAPGHDVGGFSKETKRRIDLLYKRLRQKGFDDISAAGIIGNAIQESSLDPDSVNQLGYSGLWQNSKAIRKAIEEQYGDYSYDSQLRFLDDWVSGSTWVRKGKHAKHTSTYSGTFKKTGYTNAAEAADQFLKRYERAIVVKDKKIVRDEYGNPLYQDRDKRLNYANQVYNYLTGNPNVTIKPITQTTAAEFHEVNTPPKYEPPKIIPTPPDYSITNPAPPMISSWNSPDSPSNVTIMPRVTSMKLYDDNSLPDIVSVFKQYYGN